MGAFKSLLLAIASIVIYFTIWGRSFDLVLGGAIFLVVFMASGVLPIELPKRKKRKNPSAND